MAIEIRPCRDHDEVARFMKVVDYVFASEPMDASAHPAPDWTHSAFVDGQVATTLATLPFTVRLNGNPVKMGGVTQVGTLPAYRRQGLLRQVMTQALHTMREREQHMAILWASMGAIYQRFGYGLSTAQVRYSYDPRYVQYERGPEPTGSIELLTAEDAFPVIKQNYIQWATPRNLCIHRSTVLWQVGVLRPPKKDHPVYAAVYRNAGGEPRGHVVYHTDQGHFPDPGPDQVMRVNDFIAMDAEAHRGLWDYLRRHDLVRRIDLNGMPEDDPTPELLLEPRMLNRKTSDGIWMRVVDAERALASRPYGSRGELTVAVEGDDICPWNNANFLIETDGPSAAVRRIERAPDITVSPNVLASLVSGYRPATHFARAGLLAARDESALKTADALFRPDFAPFCPNGF